MAKAIEIGVGVDSKAAKQGIDAGLIEPLENAQEALEELGKDKGPERLERNLEAAQDATERLEKDTKDTADAIEREYKAAYSKLKQESDRGYSSAAESSEAFRDEAKQNFAETASSFDGSMESIADMAQSTLGGLATSISGPLGIGLGLVGAGFGAFVAQMVASAEDMKERVSEKFQQMVENGGAAMTRLQEEERIADTYSEHWGKIKQIAELAGVPTEKVARALALGGEGAEAIISKLERLNKLDVTGANSGVAGFVKDLEAADAAAAEAQETFESYARATADAAEVQGQRLNELAAKYDKLPRDITTTVQLDTAALDRELRKPRQVSLEFVTRDGRRIY